MVKYTKKMFRYTKIKILVKCLKIIELCCLNWVFLHSAVYCGVRYSNIEHQDEIYKTYH